MLRAAFTLLLALAGCAGSNRPSLPAETFSNTVWQEVCVGGELEAVYLRFLPDGTFAWSPTGLAPGDFQHDGDDRWGIVGKTLVIGWDGNARATQYREGETPSVYVGTGTQTCEGGARLERVE